MILTKCSHDTAALVLLEEALPQTATFPNPTREMSGDVWHPRELWSMLTSVVVA
jgi:hypothetical protein